MKLNDWYVENKDEEGFPVVHFVGGEDCTEFDDWYPTERQAQGRVAVLNCEAREFTHSDYEDRACNPGYFY